MPRQKNSTPILTRQARTKRNQRVISRRAPPEPIDEVADALAREVTRCAARSSECARLIESTGALASEMTVEIHRNSSASELLQYVAALRSLALQTVHACAELNREAGRLEAIGEIREVAESASEA